MLNLRNNILIAIALLILIIFNLQFYNALVAGWLGPNASIRPNNFTESLIYFNSILNSKYIILFDDNTYLILKKYNNKKMPITYFKLYLDKIPEISFNNLNGRKALSFTNCAFIEEFKLFNNGSIVLKELYKTRINELEFCIYEFNPVIN